MDQAKAVINLNDGVIQLEGPVEFVQRYLDKYAPAVKGGLTPEPQAKTVGKRVEARGRPRGGQRSCTRAIRAEIKGGFFDEPKATQAVKQRLTEKGVTCSVGLLRTGLKKAVEEGRLGTTGRGRGLVYSRKAESGEEAQPMELSEAVSQASDSSRAA